MDAAVPGRKILIMSLAVCSIWLRTRLLVQFVALMTIGSPKNFVCKTLNYPPTCKSPIFSHWIKAKLCTITLSPPTKTFPSAATVNDGFNRSNRLLAFSKSVSELNSAKTNLNSPYLSQTSILNAFALYLHIHPTI